ncbi:MauE/DoxX family redox-associated membrane protein [Fodinicola acaciae]|uniref:MauE/DoxX family redox-associated membrane protein n=1 Tax=Fodinicola acaciae TaxID=2681555 RepID=UPI0013D3E531|nr:MauE/DoxX family redox-associated membrane protein [Fodinicola acaciae]
MIAAVQSVVLVVVLAWSGAHKFVNSDVRRTALPKLFGAYALIAYRLTGVAEIAIGAVIVVGGPAFPAALLGVGFLGYLAYARIAAPGSSCGCTGAGVAPVDWRAFVRAGLVVVAGAVGAPWVAVNENLALALPIIAVEILTFVILAPDFGLRVRALRLRLGPHPLRGLNDALPVAAIAYNLERSELFGSVAHLIRSGVRETWESDGWRILTYAADGGLTMVFAVRDRQVRLSVVDESASEIAETR